MDAHRTRPRRLTLRQRAVLSHVVGALVPAGSADATRGAEATPPADVVEALARVVEEYLPDAEAQQLLRLLGLMDRRLPMWLLAGRPRSFAALSPPRRERVLLAWADSRLELKRRAFRGLKRLALFLYYAPADPAIGAERWRTIDYTVATGTTSSASVDPLPAPAPPPSDGRIAADLCVIGSGAGGSVVAARAAEAGLSVVVLEAGPYLVREAFPSSEGPGFDRLYHSHGLLGTRDQAFSVLAGVVVGGSTTVNWMTCLAPEPFVRREWAERGMAGADAADFERHLETAARRLHVGTADSVPNANNEALARGCAALGFESGTDFETIPRNALGCAGRCQPCSFGCPFGAKQSAAETYLADARRRGARLYCDARAERLLLDRGRVGGVLASWRGGEGVRSLEVRSPRVVVAGGAIESPALLLRSGIRGAVGAGLHLHPTSAVLGEHRAPVRMWAGPMQTVVVRRFQRASPGLYGPWLESTPAHPGLAAQAAAWRGREAHADLMRRIARASATIALVRDRGAGRVRVDRSGRAVLEYRMDRRDRRELIRGLVEAARIQCAAGALRVGTLHNRGFTAGDGQRPVVSADFERFAEEVRRAGIRENAVGLFSAHPTGSLAVGPEGSGAVTDGWGRVREVEGLWVADGSLLPTAPGVNPMLSIVAVAERTAARLLAES